MTTYGVVTDALRALAGRWRRDADTIEGLGRSLAGLELDPAAFFLADLADGPGTVAAHDAYEAVRAGLAAALRTGTAQFDGIGTALTRVADAYDDADGVVELDLARVYEPPSTPRP